MKKNLIPEDSKYWTLINFRYILLETRAKTDNSECKKKLDKLAYFFRFVAFNELKEEREKK